MRNGLRTRVQRLERDLGWEGEALRAGLYAVLQAAKAAQMYGDTDLDTDLDESPMLRLLAEARVYLQERGRQA